MPHVQLWSVYATGKAEFVHWWSPGDLAQIYSEIMPTERRHWGIRINHISHMTRYCIFGWSGGNNWQLPLTKVSFEWTSIHRDEDWPWSTYLCLTTEAPWFTACPEGRQAITRIARHACEICPISPFLSEIWGKWAAPSGDNIPHCMKRFFLSQCLCFTSFCKLQRVRPMQFLHEIGNCPNFTLQCRSQAKEQLDGQSNCSIMKAELKI